MAKISPIRALHYNPSKVNLGKVITPPYDVISPTEAEAFKQQSPYNFAHVILPRDNYEEVHQLLSSWQDKQVLTRTPQSYYYLYQQEFELDGKVHRRNTFLAAVQLREFSEGVVLPHERTHQSACDDRLEILKKTQCNLSPIFTVAKDGSGVMETQFEQWMFQKPLLSAKTGDGISHHLWQVSAEKSSTIKNFLSEQPLYIVDGHHRYTSALEMAKQLDVVGKDHPAAYMFIAIANCYDPALIVYPTHRVVKMLGEKTLDRAALEGEFLISSMEPAELSKFVEQPSETPKFAVYDGTRLELYQPKNWVNNQNNWEPSLAKLSVTWADHSFLKQMCGIEDSERKKRIQYEKDFSTIWENRNQARLSVFLPPLTVADITQVSDEGAFMPQKSTYFYPKLAAGMLIRVLE